MPLVDRLYSWLASGESPDCDHILAAAWQHAEPAYAARIIRTLLSRGNDVAIGLLIEQLDALTPAIRSAIKAKPATLRAGIAYAARSASPIGRQNALDAYRDDLSPRLAYILPPLLRDPHPPLRRTAAALLREVALQSLAARPTSTQEEAAKADESAKPRSHRDDLASLGRTALETLRTYDLHLQVDVVPVALWLAPQIGDALWRLLDKPRSRVARLLHERFEEWTPPQSAGFLLLALRQRRWRVAAQQRIQSWRSPEQVAAVLANTALLTDPAVRAELSTLRQVRWFHGASDTLSELPPTLRHFAPRWVCALGLPVAAKADLLTRWLHYGDRALQRECVFALATVDDPHAYAALANLRNTDKTLRMFAEWFIAGYRLNLGSAARWSGQVDARPASQLEQQQAQAVVAALWQAARRTPAGARDALLGQIRAHAHAARGTLASYLHSPDPRDRVLALQVLAEGDVLEEFAAELRPLLADPVAGVQRLAETMLERLAARQQEAASASHAKVGAAGSVRPPAAAAEQQILGDHLADEVAAARRELDQLFTQIAATPEQDVPAAVIERVQHLLRAAELGIEV